MGTNKVIDKDHGMRRIMEAARSQAGTSYTKVGIIGEDDRGGLHVPGADLTVVEIALVNEYGTADGHVPERSFVRSTYDRMRPELEADSTKLALHVLDGKMSTEQALNILGAKLAGAMHRTITDGAGVPPPNAGAPGNPRPGPSTYQQKMAAGKWNKAGSAQAAGWGVRPLVNTGRLLNSIGWGVFTPRAGRRPMQYVEPSPK